MSAAFLAGQGNITVHAYVLGYSCQNCQSPQAPEFNRCWKMENNAGCGCYCCRSATSVAGQTIVIERNTR